MHGNYTSSAPPGWSFTQGSGGGFAPTATASPGFAGADVAYVNPSSTLEQTFASPALSGGPESLDVLVDLGTRADGAPTTGTVTITAEVGSTIVGQTTFNAVGSTAGAENEVQFQTEDLAALGLAGQNVELKIDNGTNAQLLVGYANVEAAAPVAGTAYNSFYVGNEAQFNAAIRAIDVGGSDAQANATYQIHVSGQIYLTSELLALNLESGSSVLIAGTDGSGNAQVQTIEGGGISAAFLSMPAMSPSKT